MNGHKCEVIPSAGHAIDIAEHDFPGMRIVKDGNFKLLEAAFGTVDFCQSLARKGAAKAETITEKVVDLSEADTSF